MKDYNSDISYIKSVMQRSEIAFSEFKLLFIYLAVYGLISDIIYAITADKLPVELGGSPFYDRVLAVSVYYSVFTLIALIPTVILMIFLRRRIKNKNLGISLWILDILFFIIVFCGAVLPISSAALVGQTDSAKLFAVVTAALCMLFIGIVTDKKALKTVSYFYLALPVILLTVCGFTVFYFEFQNTVPVGFVRFFAYAKAFFFRIYPCLGYLTLAFIMGASDKRPLAK